MKNPYRLPYVRKIQDINDEANQLFCDEVMMPMMKYAATVMFIAIIVDYGFQLIDAIDTLTL
jgi:hypothetical protein|tara:strand:+ start:1019 stop:1204 length:186 start_codon:yes stop_codon:yes gene_type:complete